MRFGNDRRPHGVLGAVDRSHTRSGDGSPPGRAGHGWLAGVGARRHSRRHVYQIGDRHGTRRHAGLHCGRGHYPSLPNRWTNRRTSG